MLLAIAEHWFLMLPLPVEGLWSWSLRSRGARPGFGGCAVPRPVPQDRYAASS
jgi:hypothetical protein